MTRKTCPYCPDSFMNDEGVRRHLIHRHRLSAESTMLPSKVLDERPVDLVQLPAPHCCVCGETPDYRLYENFQGQLFCSPCADGGSAEPVSERNDLATEMQDFNEGMNRATAEMAELKNLMSEVDRRVAALKTDLTKPSAVRRATLNQVWTRLHKAGELKAALVVAEMIRNVVDQ